MKVRRYINFFVSRAEGPRFKRLVEQLGCGLWWHEPHNETARPHLAHLFEEDDGRLAALKELLARERVDWFERVDVSYSERELQSAPLLRMMVLSEPLEGGGCAYGTTFDLSTGCVACGAGAIQTSALMLATADAQFNGPIVAAGCDSVVVNEGVANALRNARVSGIELRQTRVSGTGDLLPLWQILPSYTMPRMSLRSRGIFRDVSPGCGCTVCKRDMYAERIAEPVQIVYDQESLEQGTLPDVAQTWECFSRSVITSDPARDLEKRIAHGLLLVRPRVRDVLREARATAVRCEPVEIT